MLLAFFNHDRPEIAVCFRPLVHAFAILFIGSNLLQPYPDNDCVLKLLASKVLLNAGFSIEFAHLSLREMTAESFLHSLCS